jgi:hypothetical protein
VQRQVHQHGAAQPLVVVFQVQHLDCHGCASSSAHWNIWNRSCKLKHSTGAISSRIMMLTLFVLQKSAP